MFEGPRDLVLQYEQLVEAAPGANRIATGEIIRVLDQLELIVAMVRERQNAMRSALAEAGQDETALKRAATRTHGMHEEAQLLTEAFYYFAFSIVTLIRSERLPHLGKLAAKDIAIIRNALLAHYKPDPAAPFGRVGMMAGSAGPSFGKQGRDTKGVVRSGGLFDDGEAFRASLWDLFTKAIEGAKAASI